MNGVTRLAFACTILPGALLAQRPAAPANPITQSYKDFAGRYAGWLVAGFDSIPVSTYGFRPTPKQQSVGYIAQHLENANYQLCGLLSGTPYVMSSKDSLADTVKALWPKDTLIARLKASVAYCDAAVGKVSDAQLADMIPAGPPGSGRTIVRARYLLAYVTDLADHWSQLAIYMRLNGLVPASAMPRPRS